MPLLTAPIILKSVHTRGNPVRPISPGDSPLAGRALDVRNVDINRFGEPERRPGLIRRLTTQGSGMGTLIVPFDGICGRFLGRLIVIWPDGIYTEATPGAGPLLDPLNSLDASWGSSADVSWTYPGGGASPTGNCTGIRLMRRLDDYPDGPDDPEAVAVYEGDASSFTDEWVDDDEDVYYVGYALYGRGVYSLAMQTALELVTVFSDNFNRENGPLNDNDSHLWVADQVTVVDHEAYTDASLAAETLCYVPIPITDYDPLTISMKCVGDEDAWEVGYYDPVEDHWIIAQVTATGGVNFTLTVFRSRAGVTDDADAGQVTNQTPIPDGGTLSLRRSGDLVTATYGGQSVTTAWKGTDTEYYPYMRVSATWGGSAAADNFLVRKE